MKSVVNFRNALIINGLAFFLSLTQLSSGNANLIADAGQNNSLKQDIQKRQTQLDNQRRDEKHRDWNRPSTSSQPAQPKPVYIYPEIESNQGLNPEISQ